MQVKTAAQKLARTIIFVASERARQLQQNDLTC
jgi:hypothetical protein